MSYFDRIGNDIQLRPLSHTRDLEKVNSEWPYKHPGSMQIIKQMATFNNSIGAFKEDELVAWIFR